jgi:hypothetical protein
LLALPPLPKKRCPVDDLHHLHHSPMPSSIQQIPSLACPNLQRLCHALLSTPDDALLGTYLIEPLIPRPYAVKSSCFAYLAYPFSLQKKSLTCCLIVHLLCGIVSSFLDWTSVWFGALQICICRFFIVVECRSVQSELDIDDMSSQVICWFSTDGDLLRSI